MPAVSWKLPGHSMTFGGRPKVMGIVNVTPDSFSDAGKYYDPHQAIDHGRRLEREGADLLDIGGESSRPGSSPVDADEELRRVLPVIEGLAQTTKIPLSIDTWKARTAREALKKGCSIINDITGLRGDPGMVEAVRDSQAGIVVMHMQGTPATMQTNPQYADVVEEVSRFFEERLATLTGQGIDPERIVLDPGIGFGKRPEHNLALIAGRGRFGRLGRPILLGVSRKNFLEKVTGRSVKDRLAGSLAIACHVAVEGNCHLLRVHDVAATRDALEVLEALAHVST